MPTEMTVRPKNKSNKDMIGGQVEAKQNTVDRVGGNVIKDEMETDDESV
jgi:hypothetical protein